MLESWFRTVMSVTVMIIIIIFDLYLEWCHFLKSTDTAVRNNIFIVLIRMGHSDLQFWVHGVTLCRGYVQERNVREKTKFAKECDAAQHVHERLPVDIEILPQKQIVVYDTVKKELELSDGGVFRIDPSLYCSRPFPHLQAPTDFENGSWIVQAVREKMSVSAQQLPSSMLPQIHRHCSSGNLQAPA
jgi:hypothetical protein